MIVSFRISIPPLKNISLLSNSIKRLRLPRTGCKTHPLPLPPVNEILVIDSISNSWGSTNTSLTVPWIIGSTAAPIPPTLVSIPTMGGFSMSYPLPPFNKSTDSRLPKNIWLSEIGDLICTPSTNMPISLVGISWLDATNKFWDNGILLNILSASNTLLECLCKTNLCFSVVEVVGPTWTVLAVPICAAELYNFILETFWFGPGTTGSTKYVLPVSKPINASPSGWYTTGSPCINFISVFGGGVNFKKLYLLFKLLNPSRLASVPPVNVSSTISVVIS